MNNLYTSSFTDFKSLVLDLPDLKKEKLYSANVLERIKEENKKDVVLEIPDLNIFFDQFLFSHLNTIENRFWLYNYLNGIQQITFSYNFKFMDLSRKTFFFSSKKSKATALSSGFFLYNSRKHFLQKFSESTFSKHRILSLNNKSYWLSFVGNRGQLLKTFLLKKKKKRFAFSSLCIANLGLIGYLHLYSLQKWEIKNFKRHKTSVLNPFLKKYNFYYKKNLSLKSILTLEKK